MLLDTAILILNNDKPVEEPATKLRGFIGNQFPMDSQRISSIS